MKSPQLIQIDSVDQFIRRIRDDYAGWPHVWFRGEPKVDTSVLPKLYRPRPDRPPYNENRLLQLFRMKAPTFHAGICPTREATDQWLFLAQHVGLPTRLLDWTESALVALHFALMEKQPIVWMLNPIALNESSLAPGKKLGDEFPLTWVNPSKASKVNIGSINIRGAWELDKVGVERPVAVLPTNIHPRMSVQRSCFTVQGKNKESLTEQVGAEMLRGYVIANTACSDMRKELRILGISHSTMFPDLDGLARELADL